VLQSASPAIVTGDRHPRTLISINNLGMLLKAQGKLDEAGVLYNWCCTTRRSRRAVRRSAIGIRAPHLDE
jgi:hypothetical protein